jgi:hypothetical protein
MACTESSRLKRLMNMMTLRVCPRSRWRKTYSPGASMRKTVDYHGFCVASPEAPSQTNEGSPRPPFAA